MKRLFFYLTMFFALLMGTTVQAKNPKKLKALVVSGQNNHNWQVSHQVLKLILDNSELFETDIVLTAPAGGDMSNFRPEFERYDVVVLDYNGDRWPAETDAAALARFLATVLQGLTVQARDGASRAELQAIGRLAMRCWPA